jgi:hypothetical protein
MWIGSVSCVEDFLSVNLSHKWHRELAGPVAPVVMEFYFLPQLSLTFVGPNTGGPLPLSKLMV